MQIYILWIKQKNLWCFFTNITSFLRSLRQIMELSDYVHGFILSVLSFQSRNALLNFLFQSFVIGFGFFQGSDDACLVMI